MIVKNIENPVRPLTAILGGAKVSDKLPIIESLLGKVDYLIIGGAMAYTFLQAKGVQVGKSRVEADMIEMAQKMLSMAHQKGVEIFLPADHVVANDFEHPTKVYNTKSEKIEADFLGMDIGKKTIKMFSSVIKNSATVIWNGPMGVFENKAFARGTKQIAKTLAKSKVTSIVGGGDSASAVISFGLANKMTHISTGGGASLKLFEGKMLPGVEVIADK